MESDDDFEHFSVAEPESPPVHSNGRKLKRLKRAADVVFSVPLVEQPKEGLPLTDVSTSANSRLTNPVESVEEPSDRLQLSGVEDDDADFGSLPMETEKENDLMFDSVVEKINIEKGLREEIVEQVIGAPDERSHDVELVTPSDTKKMTIDRKGKKKKKETNDGLDDGIDQSKSTAVINKRREEKERRERMQQLRADSQRVLRDTRDASFKSIPMVPKPISSILEKIRQRKLEISKKTASVKSTNLALDKLDGETEEFNVKECILQREVNKEVLGSLAKEVELKPIELKVVADAGPVVQPIDIPEESLSDCNDNDSEEESLTDSLDSPVKEEFTPSLLAMNLKFDSGAQNSDDEKDNDTLNPHLGQDLDLSLPLKDPVKNFLDEEAEEEDDSDGDPFNRQQDDEEEDIEDAEELNDMIATQYVEKSIDNEMRNELHQKWLEQQDDAGMENLLWRINGGPKQSEALLSEEENQEDEEDEEGEDEEVFGSEDGLDLKSLAQTNLRKAKQMISEMFTDKDDPYISSEDDEGESIITKQFLSEKMERQTRSLSSEMDESSGEVLNRIKKLNVIPENKTRAKTSALHDLRTVKSKMNAFQKPSFVGRASNSSLLSNNKQKTRVLRPFIFRQDDRNSRSNSSVSEESSCMEDSRPARIPSAKFSNSQNKFYTETKSVSSGPESTTSLYEILRRTYTKSESVVPDVVDAQAHSIFTAFKIGK
ncbi:hypothetical protein SAY87_022268 [Trapa incisa]|uniref:Uncharacterized protein n=1 Tax=Trapa incisa TaxID=236973 RepID=A0AAN7PXP7_9MYRT|nr:hypothetical protein SAY87_022268 [Trapa incisa]